MNDRQYGMRLVGVAAYAPPNVVTNADIAGRLRRAGEPVLAALGRAPTKKELRQFETSDEWIQRFIKFTERRFVEPGQGTIDLATRAGQLLLDRTGVSPDRIGAVLFGSVSPSYLYSPPDAAMLQHALGIPAWDGDRARETFGVDLSLACSTWVTALRLAYQLIGEQEYVLVVGADAMSTTINWHDRTFACVLGDGGTATLCQRVPADQDWFGPERFYSWLDGSRAEVIITRVGGSRQPLTKVEDLDSYRHKLTMDGAKVKDDMVPFVSGPGMDAALAKAGLALDQIDHLVLHEANCVLNEGIVANLRARGFRGTLLDAGGKFGNTTSATIPLALALNPDALTTGKVIDLVAFGGGYSMASAIATLKHPCPVWVEA